MRLTIGVLVVALASFPTQAYQLPPEFVLDTDGQFEITEDGGVQRLEVANLVGVLSIDQALSALILGWRFESVIEDGVPVTVPVRYSIQLRADSSEGTINLSVQGVRVWEPAGQSGGGRGLRSPNYPSRAWERKIEADVMVYYIAHPDGSITDAHVGRVGIVRSPSTRRFRERDFNRYQRAFSRAVEVAVRASVAPDPPAESPQARRLTFQFKLDGSIRESVNGRIVREWIDLPVPDWTAAVDEEYAGRVRNQESRIEPIGDLVGDFDHLTDRFRDLGRDLRIAIPESLFLQEAGRLNNMLRIYH